MAHWMQIHDRICSVLCDGKSFSTIKYMYHYYFNFGDDLVFLRWVNEQRNTMIVVAWPVHGAGTDPEAFMLAFYHHSPTFIDLFMVKVLIRTRMVAFMKKEQWWVWRHRSGCPEFRYAHRWAFCLMWVGHLPQGWGNRPTFHFFSLYIWKLVCEQIKYRNSTSSCKDKIR